LLDRVDIRYSFDGDYKLPTSVDLSLKGIRAMVKQAWETQYRRQGKLNRDLTPEELLTYAPLSKDVDTMLTKATCGSSFRAAVSIRKLARTIADINGLENINTDCMSVALELHRTSALFEL
jgi:magnesium chelatase family protein